MTARIQTVAFQGIDVVPVDVQVQMYNGSQPGITIVGLPDKAVAESRERVRAALNALGLALPAKRIAVNLAPADLQKEGSHFDLPIALALLVSLGMIDAEHIDEFIALGELGLDGSIAPVSGILPSAIHAARRSRGIICPRPCGPEAAWAGPDLPIVAPSTLLDLINHFRGQITLPRPIAERMEKATSSVDLADIKGQASAKRALEIAAAGGHNMLMVGPPGSGKSLLAARLPTLMPRMTPEEALEVTMIHSVAGYLPATGLIQHRPFRDPHHSASLPALVGGGMRAKPGEISLAHLGVLFLDELPEFARATLESLRQPIETGRVVISRANAHITYPARVQVVAAMNPCRCGYMGDKTRDCGRAPKCGVEYQSRISGPLLDRLDLQIDVPEVPVNELLRASSGESSATVAVRVQRARDLQYARLRDEKHVETVRSNATLDGELLTRLATPDAQGQGLLERAVEKFRLSARGYHRVLRVARTIADLDGSVGVTHKHVAEALSYRRGALEG